MVFFGSWQYLGETVAVEKFGVLEKLADETKTFLSNVNT